MRYYQILSTDKNRSLGFNYSTTTEQPNSNLDYKTLESVNGTFYNIDTPKKVINILEWSRINKERIVLDYGDSETGKSWGEVYDIIGCIGRSTGPIKIPILIHNKRSIGGGSVLDHCIVRILTAKGKKVLYEHKNYHK